MSILIITHNQLLKRSIVVVESQKMSVAPKDDRSYQLQVQNIQNSEICDRADLGTGAEDPLRPQ